MMYTTYIYFIVLYHERCPELQQLAAALKEEMLSMAVVAMSEPCGNLPSGELSMEMLQMHK